MNETVRHGRVFIVRHAQSVANAGERTVDPVTIPITDCGVRQARRVADLIAEKPSIVAVSRYLRSVQTGEPLAKRFPGLPLETWPIEEFTYLDPAVCAGTTYAERTALRAAYWRRCEPSYVDGPSCESFSNFISRVRQLEKTLCTRADETGVLITHGLVMKALLWLQRHPAACITEADMAGFYNFQRRVSVPNCAVLLAERSSNGRLRLPASPSVAHIPVDLQTE
jgi:probable phosphoglycerate mutase